jgi:glutamate/tyrosine decarboxylase-like PLP-dependent enzyme
MTTPAVERSTTPLAISRDEFRKLGHDLVDRIADFLDTLPDRPVTPGDSADTIRALLNSEAPLPDSGADPATLLGSAADLLFEHSLFNGHPRFLGYITASPTPIGILGDLLASAVNPNVGAWTLSPVATEIEEQTVRWIADLVGYPRGGGLLVSGGNMANLVGFFAARAAAADWDVRAAGVAAPAARPLRVYASAETHTWIQKAADLSGLGTDAIRWIPTDESLRMDTAALRAAIERDRAGGDRPMIVVGTAGSVSTGAVDPLFDIAEVCRERGIWFHVDGAYGGFGVAVPGTPRDLEGLRLADSVALDPHKWLYAPLEAGCTLVRDAETLRRAFSYHPPYYNFGVEATNFVDFGPQNSRGFRALKVWLALRQAGRDGYVQMIGDDIRLTQRLFRLVDAHPEFEACTLGLSIATFRYVPPDLDADAGSSHSEEYLNRLNETLVDRIQTSGETFVSNAVLDGRYVLRLCIVNFNTRAADIDALPEIIARLGRETHMDLGREAG